MTLTKIKIDDLPPLNVFFGTVSPGIDKLEDNIHFIHEDYDSEEKANLVSILWPLNDNNNVTNNSDASTVVGKLTPTYLNISRGPLNPGPGIFESNTYVSLPYHITNLFDKVIKYKTQNKTVDGGFQIGANAGSLMPDPSQYVQLNPGCLTEILDINDSPQNGAVQDPQPQPQTALDKLTNNVTKLLKFSTSTTNGFHTNNFHDLISSINKSTIFDKVLNFDSELYYKTLGSADTEKLLVACHVNVLNIIAIDSSANYTNPITYQADKPYVSLLEIDDREDKEKQEPKTFSYAKKIEVPILRLQLHHKLIITCMRLFKSGNDTNYVILGLNSGAIIVINLANLTYLILDNYINEKSPNSITGSSHLSGNNLSTTIINEAVTCLEVIDHPVYDFLVIAGYSNGELIILNPFTKNIKPLYNKEVIDQDQFVTYFKKFDLSGFNIKSLDTDSKEENVVVGHLKLSHRPIATIRSTISLVDASPSGNNPHLLAIGGIDGLVRIINLSFTFNSNYGDNKRCIITDIISTYLQDGVLDITFSNDFKFLAIAGNGDIVELFKLTYYNINTIINQQKNPQTQTQLLPSQSLQGRRSRSGTTNSIGSNNVPSMPAILTQAVASYSTNSPSTLVDGSKNTDHNLYPPIIKQMKLVCRLKGHSNSVCKVLFVKPQQVVCQKDQLLEPELFYRLITYGNDGKVIFWEFDYKALPKIKKITKKRVTSPSSPNASPVAKKTSTTHTMALRGHSKTKSDESNFLSANLTLSHSLHGSVQNMNSLLTPNTPKSTSFVNLTENDPIRNVVSLYTYLYEIRTKRHYTKLLMEQHKVSNKSYPCIIHPVVNDKWVPSIEIPLSEVDFTYWFKDGKISNIYVDQRNFWCMGKGGDIIKYDIL